jgi:hypothetical protein
MSTRLAQPSSAETGITKLLFSTGYWSEGTTLSEGASVIAISMLERWILEFGKSELSGDIRVRITS